LVKVKVGEYSLVIKHIIKLCNKKFPFDAVFVYKMENNKY